MNKNFHYDLIYYLSARAGCSLEDSYMIAYASQYVDDNTFRYVVKSPQGEEYVNYISQTKDITKPGEEQVRIYGCFHFVPGDLDYPGAERKNGAKHDLNTTPNSKNVNTIMDAALETKNLYRIGIALHAYADTWSHQNFVGVKDRFNKLDGMLPKILPDIGHADAMYKPDIPRYEWQDKRLLPEFEHIINNVRIIKAAESLFFKLTLHINPNMNSSQMQNKWQPIKSELQNALGTFNKGSGNVGYDVVNLRKSVGNTIDYSKESWLNSAVDIQKNLKNDKITDKPIPLPILFPDICYKRPDFENSDWYCFQQSIKEHQKFVIDLCHEVFYNHRIDNF